MKLNIRNNKKLLISLIVVTVYLILSFTILFIGLYSKNTITDIENGDKRVANSINVFTKENNWTIFSKEFVSRVNYYRNDTLIKTSLYTNYSLSLAGFYMIIVFIAASVGLTSFIFTKKYLNKNKTK